MRNYETIENAAIATAEYLQYDGPLFPFPENLYDEIKTIVNAAKSTKTPIHFKLEMLFPGVEVTESNNYNGWGFRLEFSNKLRARIEETTYGDRYSKKIAIKVTVGCGDTRHFPINKLGDFNWTKIIKFVNDTVEINARRAERETEKHDTRLQAKKTASGVNKKHGLIKWVSYGEKPTDGYYRAGPVAIGVDDYGKFKLVFDCTMDLATAEKIAVFADSLLAEVK